MAWNAPPIVRVSALYRFPVKSLLGERVDRLSIGIRGVDGDRLYAVTDAAGKLGSHKETRRFAKLPNLFNMQARINEGDTRIVFPNGDELSAEDPDIHNRVSDIVGEPVTVKRETDVSHFDDGAIHIISTASLNWLQSILPSSQVDALRFRSNVVIDCAGNGPVENDWLGKTLTAGSVAFDVTSKTERCVMTTLAQRSLPRDPEILTQIGRKADLNFGVYARVSRAGTLAVDDEVVISG
ncbi:MAG: MOSC domain-containing protein [Pseudomonadota bacterium]